MTPWRLQIRHDTGYQYTSSVHTSYNEARLSPLDTPQQRVLEHKIDVLPTTNVRIYRDYWETWVCAFDLHTPHDELLISSRSLVETGLSDAGTPVPIGWRDLTEPRIADRFCEFLSSTPYTEISDAVSTLVEPWRVLPEPVMAVRAAHDWIQSEMTYERGSTTVTTTAAEALQQRRGVCQDFAHLGLAMLRAMGIPARYISGYSLPNDEAPIGLAVEGQSHAWIEAWLGDWMPLDPTTGREVGSRHVVVARGRDYGDVPPLKGVYHGGLAGALDVAVELTRLA